jgi:CspA family cold shock protein
MKTGTLKWFSARKGYGFLKPVDGGFDVYVHISAFERAGMMDLKEGQTINFEIVADDRTGEARAENLSPQPGKPEAARGRAGETPTSKDAQRPLIENFMRRMVFADRKSANA